MSEGPSKDGTASGSSTFNELSASLYEASRKKPIMLDVSFSSDSQRPTRSR